MLTRPARSLEAPIAGVPWPRQGSRREALIGAAAGAVATLAMSGWMLLAQRLGLEGEQPPERIVERALDAVGADRSETAENALASVTHLAFGGICGGLYRGLRSRLRTPGPPVLHGIGFGLAVYTVSYAGWMPALGVLPPPPRDRHDRQATMLAAHVVYGAVLGWLAEPRR